MNTDDWIDLLARQAGPAPRALVARRLAPALAGGFALGLALALGWRGLVAAELFSEPGMWLKLGYAAALAAAAAWWVARLGRPASPEAGPRRAVAGVVLAVALMGALAWGLTAPEGRAAALLGHSWAGCPFNVLVLSLPALAGALWALRGLAPTRPRLAGAAAGLLAGAVGALAYGFSCTELAPPFVAAWYTAGIGLVAALGSALGPRLLRW